MSIELDTILTNLAHDNLTALDVKHCNNFPQCLNISIFGYIATNFRVFCVWKPCRYNYVSYAKAVICHFRSFVGFAATQFS